MKFNLTECDLGSDKLIIIFAAHAKATIHKEKGTKKNLASKESTKKLKKIAKAAKSLASKLKKNMKKLKKTKGVHQ